MIYILYGVLFVQPAINIKVFFFLRRYCPFFQYPGLLILTKLFSFYDKIQMVSSAIYRLQRNKQFLCHHYYLETEYQSYIAQMIVSIC